MELVEIAADKGMRTINISDHGSAARGRKMVFNVLTDRRRVPEVLTSRSGTAITVLAGIEANILDAESVSDLPETHRDEFDLISAGFHGQAERSKERSNQDRIAHNMWALERYLSCSPIDILTHPCTEAFPLDVERVVDLSLQYGFALEVNNTNLRLGKTNGELLEAMLQVGQARGCRFVENSDGHFMTEIGENEKIMEVLARLQLDGDAIFLNRHEARLRAFIDERRHLPSRAAPGPM